VVTSPVLRAIIHDPAPLELRDFLEEHLRSGECLVQVVGECEVFYQGRAASVADAGDYVVMVKRDGSLQVHSHRGVKPVNWQPQSDDMRVQLEDGSAVLYSERFTPAEMVRVAFLEPVLAQALALRETSGFVLMGSESEMQRALARSPDLIEEGLTLLDRELPTDVGGIDLYARDRKGNLVVVELKRGKAGQEAVHQLYRYVERVRALAGMAVRGILAAPAITAPALEQLQRQGLEFREVTALPLEEESEMQPTLFELTSG
jgi:RecB family endonuclease NucS